MTSLRYLQTLTAGAALFAILGACGLAPLVARRGRSSDRIHLAAT